MEITAWGKRGEKKGQTGFQEILDRSKVGQSCKALPDAKEAIGPEIGFGEKEENVK